MTDYIYVGVLFLAVDLVMGWINDDGIEDIGDKIP